MPSDETKSADGHATKHTPGPWRDRDANGKYLASKTRWHADYDGRRGRDDPLITTACPILAGKETVALVVGKGNDDSHEESVCANARRITAAVNACEGISTEALEAGAVAGLLAACRSVVAACDGGNPQTFIPRISEAAAVCRAAIAFAKAEGSARG